MILVSNASDDLEPPAEDLVRDTIDPLVLATRIFRISNGKPDDDLDDVGSSAGFRNFLASTGTDLGLAKPVFDVTGYLSNFPRTSWSSINAVQHYCENGALNGFAPHPMIDPHYLAEAEDTADLSGPEAYVALLENTEAPFLKPNAYFDPDLWAETEPLGSSDSPVVNFLQAKTVTGRTYSRYFSPSYYCRHDPQLRRDSPLTFLHFLSHVRTDPMVEGSPLFQNGWYAMNYGIYGVDPLRHFLTIGADQGFYPNPYAEDELRIKSVHSVVASIGDILRSYIEIKAGKR